MRRPGDHRAVGGIRSKRGTYYGFFQRQPQLRRSFISFIFVGLVGGSPDGNGESSGAAIAGRCVADTALPRHAPGGMPRRGRRNGGGTKESESRFRNPPSGYRPGQRLHVRQPLRHKRLGRHLPSRRSKASRWRRRPRSFRSTPFSASQGRSFRDGCPTNGSTGAVTVSP